MWAMEAGENEENETCGVERGMVSPANRTSTSGSSQQVFHDLVLQ